MMRSFVAATLTAVLLLLVACETAPLPEGELVMARAALDEAEADPGISKYAPDELERAKNLLAAAESTAQQKGGREALVAHYAYLSMQMARIAAQRAREQVAMARVQAGETERKRLEASPPSPQSKVSLDGSVTQTARGMLLTLDDGTFDKNLAVIKPGARRGLDALAAFLNENPGRRIQIEAFTDAEGASGYNLELSQDRADAVALAVIDRGVDASRLRAVGWGERYPVASNDSESTRQRNRRVEITVSKGDAAVPVRAVSGP